MYREKSSTTAVFTACPAIEVRARPAAPGRRALGTPTGPPRRPRRPAAGRPRAAPGGSSTRRPTTWRATRCRSARGRRRRAASRPAGRRRTRGRHAPSLRSGPAGRPPTGVDASWPGSNHSPTSAPCGCRPAPCGCPCPVPDVRLVTPSGASVTPVTGTLLSRRHRVAGPLSGIRVVELGQVIAGPFCGQLLGDSVPRSSRSNHPAPATCCASGASADGSGRLPVVERRGPQQAQRHHRPAHPRGPAARPRPGHQRRHRRRELPARDARTLGTGLGRPLGAPTRN